MTTSFFIQNAIIEDTLSRAPVEGKHVMDPFNTLAKKHNLPINILENHRVSSSEAEAHRHEADLWICLEGEVEFVVDGEMVNPQIKPLPNGNIDDREIKAKEIKGGTSYILKKGDILWIPAGQPHLHRTTDGTARLYIIKVPAREIVPLEAVPGWKTT